MIKTTIGLIAVSAFFALGCGDSSSPTEPTLTRPTPNASLVPVVESVARERGQIYYNQLVVRGINLAPGPIVTFESAGAVVRLTVGDQLDSAYIVVEVPRGTPLGTYTPCVRTFNGKGCGNFLVTVSR